MTEKNKDKLKNQRVFQHTSGRYILLTKAGKAVSFLQVAYPVRHTLSLHALDPLVKNLGKKI